MSGPTGDKAHPARPLRRGGIMKKIVSDRSTEIRLDDTEAKNICKLGEGEKSCAFLAPTGDGFECIRMSYPANGSIFSRLEEGAMNAKGKGGWEGCPWQESLDHFDKNIKDKTLKEALPFIP